jgi:hypothetical protein
MKKIIPGMALIAIVLMACNSSSTKKATDNTKAETVAETPKDTASSIATTVSLKGILDSYLQMKNAFAADNDKAAGTAGDNMVKAFARFNKSALTAEQVKMYADIEEDAREHAEHIATNVGKIKHQREHFAMLSKDVYELVKTFGGGQQLYYDHCPMYNDGKGGNWLSETKEIKNPYLGKAMPDCGTVKEELK